MNEYKVKSTKGSEITLKKKTGPQRICSTLPKHACKSVSAFLELLAHLCSQLFNGLKNENNLLKSNGNVHIQKCCRN